ncbi:MAG: acyl-CoA-binding protein [archaeon]|nr:acyl-CoA-binding protein [archaeon]
MEKHFEKAAADIKKHGKNLSNDQLLKLYSLYKQGTIGDINTERPGMLDFKGKAKWDAWNGVKGMPQNEAKKQYVEYVLQFLPEDVKKEYN